jgi:hypothetical protein
VFTATHMGAVTAHFTVPYPHASVRTEENQESVLWIFLLMTNDPELCDAEALHIEVALSHNSCQIPSFNSGNLGIINGE